MVGAGVVDIVVQYVTSDINHGVAADWEYKGRPWLSRRRSTGRTRRARSPPRGRRP